MKIYDISQELLSSAVYPGDTAPALAAVRRTSKGDGYNLSDLTLCVHNGTHIDAPFHFLGDGATVEQIPPEKTVGVCAVVHFDGLMTAADALAVLQTAKSAKTGAEKRVLLKGDAIVGEEAAAVFAENGVWLVGVESQSVGDAKAPAAVHRILLGSEVVLLEGLRLGQVPTGAYLLCAAPLCLAGADGAPCRALLVDMG